MFSSSWYSFQGPTWHGASGVHTHMTNTRITDAEVLERRYPVVLRAFALRRGSGGAGRRRGGAGVVRVLEFRVRVAASILSERRVFRPYGRHGGRAGARGVNWWVRRVKRTAPPVVAAKAHKEDEEGRRGDEKKKDAEGEGEGEGSGLPPKDIINVYDDKGAYDGGYDDNDGDDTDDGCGYEERYISLGGKNTAYMQPGERIIICTPGGGGWGREGSGDSDDDDDNGDGDDGDDDDDGGGDMGDDDDDDDGGGGGGDGRDGVNGAQAAVAAHDARYAWRAGGSLLARSQLQEQS